MTDARKAANKKWDKENMISVSTRIYKKDKEQLASKLNARKQLSIHAFIKNCVSLYLTSDDEQLLRLLETGTRDKLFTENAAGCE